MKHLIAIFFLLSYAVASNGVSLEYMICGKNMSSKEASRSCCKKGKEDKKCCKQQVETKKLTIDQQVKDKISFIPDLHFTPLFQNTFLPVTASWHPVQLVAEVNNNGPPVAPRDPQAALCVFRI